MEEIKGKNTSKNNELSQKDELNRLLDERLKIYKERFLYFIYGLGLLVVLLTTFGLLGGADIIRSLHNKAFPPEGADNVAISYEAVLELRGNDPRLQSNSINFYTRPKQRVEVYADIFHRFTGDEEERKVIVSVDGKPISKPLTKFQGGFQDITNNLIWDTAFEREKYVHQLGFSLDDSQKKDLPDEITIICVILVYGGVK